jgi:hypothetical protein
MDNNFNQEIFKGKKFSDLLQEIHKKANDRSNQIKILIEELKPFVKSIGDATVIIPMIKDYLDIDVKNNDLLVKIAVVIQRHLQKTTNVESDLSITSDEIDQLIQNYNENKTQLNSAMEKNATLGHNLTPTKPEVKGAEEDE